MWAVFMGWNHLAGPVGPLETCYQNKRRLVPPEECWNVVKEEGQRVFLDVLLPGHRERHGREARKRTHPAELTSHWIHMWFGPKIPNRIWLKSPG